MTSLSFCGFLGFKKLDSTLHSSLVLLFLFFLFAVWTSLNCVRSHPGSLPESFQVHLYLGGQYHKCVHPLMSLHYLSHS